MIRHLSRLVFGLQHKAVDLELDFIDLRSSCKLTFCLTIGAGWSDGAGWE